MSRASPENMRLHFVIRSQANTDRGDVAKEAKTQNRREICYYDSLNNALCYYRTPNVSIVIIGFQTMRPCYYRILASFNQISASNTCIWDMK
jgi:hypothetical protein